MTTKTVIASMINGGKLMSKILKYEYRPFESFETEISSLYSYSKLPHSFATFKEIFFNAVSDDKEIPNDIILSVEKYFKGISEEMDINAFMAIKARVIQLQGAKKIRDCFIALNEKETEEVRNLLFDNWHCPKTFYYVNPLIYWANRHHKIDRTFIYKMFEYGYIVGKREERAKRKERERREKGN